MESFRNNTNDLDKLLLMPRWIHGERDVHSYHTTNDQTSSSSSSVGRGFCFPKNIVQRWDKFICCPSTVTRTRALLMHNIIRIISAWPTCLSCLAFWSRLMCYVAVSGDIATFSSSLLFRLTLNCNPIDYYAMFCGLESKLLSSSRSAITSCGLSDLNLIL